MVQPVHVVSSDGLRGSVSFTLRNSDKSTITQEVVMDAMCPYIKFNTEVHEILTMIREIYRTTDLLITP